MKFFTSSFFYSLFYSFWPFSSSLPSSPSIRCQKRKRVEWEEEDHQEAKRVATEANNIINHGLFLNLPPRGIHLPFANFGYEPISILSYGQFNSIHLVSSFQTGQMLVAKMIDLNKLNPQKADRVNQEANYLNYLRHPHIVQYHDSFFTNTSFIIIMEYCARGDLFNKIVEMKENGKYFTENQILQWFKQIVLGLQHMHSRGILHCDLKTTNIFLASDGTAKIGDLGSSRELQKVCRKKKMF